MLTSIILAIVGIGVVIYESRDEGYDIGFHIITSIIGAIVGAALGVLIAIALPMDTYKKEYSFNIESLRDNNNYSGKFFIGSGYIEGRMKYVFYYEEDGFYKIMQLDYSDVQIKLSDSKPKVKITQIRPTDSWINNFAIDTDCFNMAYIIEVPKGTINNNYYLDAQ